jgi:hypothetical protein
MVLLHSRNEWRLPTLAHPSDLHQADGISRKGHEFPEHRSLDQTEHHWAEIESNLLYAFGATAECRKVLRTNFPSCLLGLSRSLERRHSIRLLLQYPLVCLHLPYGLGQTFCLILYLLAESVFNEMDSVSLSSSVSFFGPNFGECPTFVLLFSRYGTCLVIAGLIAR